MNRLQHMLSKIRQGADASWRWLYSVASESLQNISNQTPSKWLSTRKIRHIPLLRHDLESMKFLDADTWNRRKAAVFTRVAHLLWIFVTYLLSEMVIWALSRALAKGNVEFLSSICSMFLVFICMGIALLLWRSTERVYQQFIKPKVDFINAHMGIGFPVPIIMLNEDDILDSRDIACILGNAVITNAISWTLVFLLSYLSWSAYLRIASNAPNDQEHHETPQPLTTHPPQIDVTWYTNTDTDEAADDTYTKISRSGTATPSTAVVGDITQEDEQSHPSQAPEVLEDVQKSTLLSSIWPTGVAFICVFLVGAPVSAAVHDNRALDAFVLWLLWISAVCAQRAFKASNRLRRHPRVKSIMATMMNPVLMTTLTMVGYTRARAEVRGAADLTDILKDFSAGSPLYALWTSRVQGATLPTNPRAWFGAGDAALSLLECGIFIWGFKLFECRRQLFSAAGALAVIVPAIAAVGNVFLSVLAARAMGLTKPEALAFAARSATLALAKPAIEALGGNTVVNAALVVGNGIFGQLMYPFVLDLLGVQSEVDSPLTPSSDVDVGEDHEKQMKSERGPDSKVWTLRDDAATVAAGIAIGVNGAAMGVAYLYETRSRAAPYAALSMTVFGVMTLLLSTVGPFRSFVIDLASG